MSLIKSISTLLTTSDSIDINQLDPSVQIEVNKIYEYIQDQLFFDPNLNYEQLMFLLNERDTIERKFIEFLIDRIYDLNIDPHIRDRILFNINQFSSNLIRIHQYSNYIKMKMSIVRVQQQQKVRRKKLNRLNNNNQENKTSDQYNNSKSEFSSSISENYFPTDDENNDDNNEENESFDPAWYPP
ncbi:unnamed protein product [Rotaria sordida]|uniref:Uncharacterized protein n=1 Tax=Rotaria sordida TaxID=392033 RepID=A0A816DSW4_9BILA|nr:unnamed protein product [Rotaria sordida]CAF1642900.1 unnamed protein product [Rotaria sordida]